MSKIFKRQLELTNSSTKECRSVNSSETIIAHLRPQHILPANEAPLLRQNVDSARAKSCQ